MTESRILAAGSGKSAWDEYVRSHPDSVFYQLSGWGDALSEVFGFKSMCLEARSEGRLSGVMPLVLIDNIAGKRLVSAPIAVYAGAIGNSPVESSALVEKAIELTKELGCGYLELRNMRRSGLGLPTKEMYSTFIKELPKDPGECLVNLPRKARAAARSGIESGFIFDTGLGYLDDCYRLYAVNQRKLGSPVVSRRWFEKLAEVFKNETDVLVVKFGGKVIAAVMSFFYKNTVLPFYGASDPGCLRLNPNDYMYLKLQEYGVMKGYRIFDFGRSRKGSGSYRFKINMGFEPAGIFYEYYLNRAKSIPGITPSNRSFNLARNIWKRLPLSVTNRLGPELFKLVIP
jgi:FemAB-related protein (PEP-CTERM system-associated)